MPIRPNLSEVKPHKKPSQLTSVLPPGDCPIIWNHPRAQEACFLPDGDVGVHRPEVVPDHGRGMVHVVQPPHHQRAGYDDELCKSLLHANLLGGLPPAVRQVGRKWWAVRRTR